VTAQVFSELLLCVVDLHIGCEHARCMQRIGVVERQLAERGEETQQALVEQARLQDCVSKLEATVKEAKDTELKLCESIVLLKDRADRSTSMSPSPSVNRSPAADAGAVSQLTARLDNLVRICA
jgi:hypothetical protein